MLTNVNSQKAQNILNSYKQCSLNFSSVNYLTNVKFPLLLEMVQEAGEHFAGEH